jgi:hypothetical protein
MVLWSTFDIHSRVHRGMLAMLGLSGQIDASREQTACRTFEFDRLTEQMIVSATEQTWGTYYIALTHHGGGGWTRNPSGLIASNKLKVPIDRFLMALHAFIMTWFSALVPQPAGTAAQGIEGRDSGVTFIRSISRFLRTESRRSTLACLSLNDVSSCSRSGPNLPLS